MQNTKKIKVGIGFATGRKSFQKALRTNIHNWEESGLVDNNQISLNLFVAYDLKYDKTKTTDYTNVPAELADQLDSSTFIGNISIREEIDYLTQNNILSSSEAHKIFGTGYASNRNALLYFAIKSKIDYLVFIDDDEYPMAVTHKHKTALWGGQDILSTHIQYIDQADITHGHHCGYVSPVPFVEFNDLLKEDEFRQFIEAISNEIVNWDTLKSIMDNGGVTYADIGVLTSDCAVEVEEINHAKFISGANLCINLKDINRVFPFYNPPGARGEDTFLSTCLSERKVLRVPCYAFHDGFSAYKDLLEGVLPIRLKFIKADNERVITRFYKACIGWIRYKPLLLYITQPDNYEAKIQQMRGQLADSLPKICAYFNEPNFMNVAVEMEKYHKNVRNHYREFSETQHIWKKIMEHFTKI